MGTVEGDVKDGLLSSPKHMPDWYLFDREGSIKREMRKEEKHNYMHRAEMEILKENAKEIVDGMPCPSAVVDLGCGDAVKTRLLLNEMLNRQPTVTYYAVDISADYLQDLCTKLAEEYGRARVRVVPVPGDYNYAVSKLSMMEENKAIVFFQGLQNLPHADQIQLLKKIRMAMTDVDRLIISLDITTDRTEIELAYKPDGDPAKHLAFNSMLRLNREFGNGKIDTTKFALGFDIVVNSDPCHASVVQYRAVSTCRQTFYLDSLGLTVEFQEGEAVFLADSHKYTEQQVQFLVAQGNLGIDRVFKDKRNHAGIFCLKPLPRE